MEIQTTSFLIENTHTVFNMVCKEGKFNVVTLIMNKPFKALGINWNAQHVNGMTPDFAVHNGLFYGY